MTSRSPDLPDDRVAAAPPRPAAAMALRLLARRTNLVLQTVPPLASNPQKLARERVSNPTVPDEDVAATTQRCATVQDVVTCYHFWRAQGKDAVPPPRSYDAGRLPRVLHLMLRKMAHQLESMKGINRAALLRSSDSWQPLLAHGAAVAMRAERTSDAARSLQPLVRTYGALPAAMRFTRHKESGNALHPRAFVRMVRGAERAVANTAAASGEDDEYTSEEAARDAAALLWSFARMHILTEQNFIAVKTGTNHRVQRRTGTSVTKEELQPSRETLRHLSRTLSESVSRPWEAANALLDLCTLEHKPTTRELKLLLAAMSGRKATVPSDDKPADTGANRPVAPGDMSVDPNPDRDAVVVPKVASPEDSILLPRDALATLRAAAYVADMYAPKGMPLSVQEDVARIVDGVVSSLRYTMGKRRHDRQARYVKLAEEHRPTATDVARIFTNLRSLWWRPSDEQLGTLLSVLKRARPPKGARAQLLRLDQKTLNGLRVFSAFPRTGMLPTESFLSQFEKDASEYRRAEARRYSEQEEWHFVPTRNLIDAVVVYAMLSAGDFKRSEALLSSFSRALGNRFEDPERRARATKQDLGSLFLAASWLEKTSASTARLGDNLAHAARRAHEANLASLAAPAAEAALASDPPLRRGGQAWVAAKDAAELHRARSIVRELTTEVSLVLGSPTTAWTPAAATGVPGEQVPPKDAAFWLAGRAAVHVPRSSLTTADGGPRGALAIPLMPSDVAHPIGNWQPSANTVLSAALLRRLGFGPVVFLRPSDPYLSRVWHRAYGRSDDGARAGAAGERVRELFAAGGPSSCSSWPAP